MNGSPQLQRLEQAVLAMPMARTLGLRFVRLAPGEVEIEMPIAEPLTFRPGQLQATPVFAVADFAAVSAAGSVLPDGAAW
jgi:acyl-coenzyme A thioesterase PaaI-like protein